ncbi:hypothetical protein [Collinsella intestinalis]|uniref:hypothetical protein n=1 Tax=Collinsella intestinalis TaxID=147207 RepID=UPI001957018A|nr:hypothetical protein [Collinsella intestinalis]MBM6941987.1 hypothetical protein [Collinsella intestinalis]
MRGRKTFQIHLNPELIEEFSASLDAHEHISEQISFVEKAFREKSYRGVPAWDCTCACIQRIRSIVGYLNDQVLGKMEHGNAFDFVNFINNASVMLDSIDMLAGILGVDLEQENARTDAFNKPGTNGKGTDKKYFEFLRSLCAVHPVETNRYKGVYHTTDIVTCPYLIWVSGSPFEMVWNCDLHAHAFVNEANSWGEDICIHMDQVFAHIKYRYSLLNKIGCALERFQEAKIDEFRNTPVPDRGEGESELSYVERLKEAEAERFGPNNDFVYDFAKKALSFEPTDPANKAAAERYKNAWRFALDLQLNVLRDMSREGVEHAGIEGDDTDWILFEHLEYCSCPCEELSRFSYNLEKIGYLDGTSGESDAAWGRIKLREMDGILGKHVVFDYENDSDGELYMLSRIALYEIALEHDCEINEAIPLDERYRPQR